MDARTGERGDPLLEGKLPLLKGDLLCKLLLGGGSLRELRLDALDSLGKVNRAPFNRQHIERMAKPQRL
eukprot:CAMPEP_0119079518 /NCGR_PEP_ID=MMETSP1178-20130426/107470_1 /TAXON_ID=33656 /ORGANISM="unid sp, Strain CCMP2000" /LENGTH=68 /DNA_ID=CAMNT_0007062041 /DNA_START=335 /DNA_END=538 /DNA_ORIENTATION=-